MRHITMQMAQFKAELQEGASLCFENCKGGYFSDVDEYGLKVIGKALQDGIPTPDAPVDIQCVKAGSKVRVCGKNLFNAEDFIEEYNATNPYGRRAVFTTFDGLECIMYYAHNKNMRFMQGMFKENTQYTISMHAYCVFTEGSKPAMLRILYTDGKIEDAQLSSANEWHNFNLITDANKTVDYICVSAYMSSAPVYVTTCQIEEGATATGYEPHISSCVITPCDLYDGDIWYPMSGKVEKYTNLVTIKRITAYIPKKYDEYVWFNINEHDVPGIKPKAKVWCKLFPYKNTWWFEGYAIQSHLTSIGAYFSLRYSDLGEGYNIGTDNTTLVNAGTNWIKENNFDIVYELATPVLKQYDPQPIFAHQGEVNIIQSSVDLTANLKATMLTRR